MKRMLLQVRKEGSENWMRVLARRLARDSITKAAISLSGKTVPEVKILMQKKLLDNQGMNIDN